ncbi:MAG: transcription-repair coupling factor [Candidatus Eisenbacteria bacterium]
MISHVRRKIRSAPPVREWNRRLAEGRRLAPIGGAGASILSFLAADLVEESGETVLLVAPRPDEAELFAEELEGLIGEERVFLLPSWELVPYEAHSPSLGVTALRQAALGHLARGGASVVVTTPRAIQPRIVPRRIMREHLVDLGKGEDVDLEELTERLVHIGFRRTSVADEPGTFARRGGILDLFPSGRERPYRIEFFGDEIESIREYDPESQRSIRSLEEIRVTPQTEFPLPDETVRRAQELPVEGEEGELLERGVFFDGIERYLPLLFPGRETVFDYLPEEAVVIALEEREILASAGEYWQEAVRFHGALEKKGGLPAPEDAFLDPREMEAGFRSRRYAPARRGSHAGGEDAVSIRFVPAPSILGKMDLLEKEIRKLVDGGFGVYVFCDNSGQADRMKEILEPFTGEVAVGAGKLRRGFLLPDERLAVFADHEIFRRLRRPRLERRRRRGITLDSLLALKEGDHVVHVGHGIGRFVGMKRIAVEGVSKDCVVLEYAGRDRLFVPTDQMDFLQKYSGSGEGAAPAVDRIGGVTWAKTKARAERAVRKIAEGLLRLYAARRAKPGHAFAGDGPWQRELETSFLYEETEHQAAAVRDVKRDMEAPRPMDRLVCGDVGYGKTEIAIRAAFKAVLDGKQVAVLVPTTLLAHQHLRTFRDRYGGFPVRVEALSRFRRPAELKQVVRDLADGKVDVVIGTHRLLQKDIAFHDLGLVVIDEEQRFGVTQKEKLKRMRETVDVLTLTATPIPRTLHMSISGVRDMSVIDTPPKDRLPIVTELAEFDPEVITAAILREIDRGGQVYFVHNRVRSIGSMAAWLSRVIPEAKIGVAHGQMTERKLESVMLDFLEKRIDILVTTMIIESGLDIPSVNTMLVNRADHFGLAQLYQLRGRVGRSSHRAYTYLIVPRDKSLTEEATKRLEAITTHTDLGSGYRIAMKDLEIRGAGNLLGAEQHGFVASVGFEMYCKLLEEAVRDLKGETKPAPPATKVEAAFDSFLPDGYVGDPDLKIVLYRRLAETRNPEDVDRMREETADRFGRLPEEAERLFALREMKLRGEGAGAESVRLGARVVRVRFPEGRVPAKKRLERVVRAFGEDVRFEAGEGLTVEASPGGERAIDTARKLLAALA